MRILFVSNLYPPNVVGGYERLCFEVASAFVGRGHEVFVLTSGYGGRVASYEGQQIERSLRLLVGDTIYAPFQGDADARRSANDANVAALGATLGTVEPDAVFCWNLFFFDPTLLDALTASGVPVVAMLTDNWLANMFEPDFVASFFRDSVFGDKPFPSSVLPDRRPAIGRRLIDRLLGRDPIAPQAAPKHRLALHAVFGSRFMQDFYREGGFGLLSHRVIHNGVAQDVPDDAGLPDRAQPVLAGEFRILFAGRLVDLKGADTAVDALPLLDHPSARLTIVGDEQDVAYMERIRSAIAASPAASRINLAPPVRADALLDLFNAHDVYVFPSLYEPFSLTLIHALACGIPTIASRAGGNVEIVHDGMSGLLFDKGDARGLATGLRRLASDGALRTALARGGREVASDFTVVRMIDQMELYLSDVARGG